MELKHLADRVHTMLSPRETFGPSEAIGKVIAAIEQVAKSNFSVLIVGETGSGKEVVARAIHQASKRARHPFVPVDCGAVPEALFESELFGHERGAFTGADQKTVGKIEATHTGTLFLDEISNMPLASQAKLLRVLQEKTLYRLGGVKPIRVDTRMLTASGQDLEALCECGSFRPDLYFRLNEYTISIPPLRERREDILLPGQAVHGYSQHRALQIRARVLSHGHRGNADLSLAGKRAPASLRGSPRRADGRGRHRRGAPGFGTWSREAAGGRRSGGTYLRARQWNRAISRCGRLCAATRSTWSGRPSSALCAERAETKPRPRDFSRSTTRPFTPK